MFKALVFISKKMDFRSGHRDRMKIISGILKAPKGDSYRMEVF